MVAITAGAVWTAAPAAAHATVVSSAPVDGAHLDASPTVLTFELNEPVSLVDGSAQILDTSGTRHAFASERLEDGARRIVLDVGKPLPDGAYLATARVISADTHVVSLSIRFTVGTVTGPGQWSDVGDGQSAIDRVVLLPVKAVEYLGLLLSVGLFLAARWAWPDSVDNTRLRTGYRLGAALLTVGLLGRFAILVTEQAGGLAAVSGSTIATVAGTPFGAALLIAAGLGLFTVAYRPHPPLMVGVLFSVSAIAAVTLGGHGAATELWPLPFVATFVHVYAVAVWLGGVAVIALIGADEAQVRRWHRAAVGHVALAVIAGLTLALLQVRPLAALVTTSYGLTLAVKVSLVAAVVGAGYLVYRHGAVTTRNRTVLVECGLALLVVAATSSLTSVTPAKDSYTTDVARHLDFGANAVLDVDIDTVRRGAQVVTVDYPNASGQAADVGVELSCAQANVARLPVTMSAQKNSDGTTVWRSEGLIVPAAGRWKVTVRFDDGQGPKLASFYYEVL
jgi:copper transport protein